MCRNGMCFLVREIFALSSKKALILHYQLLSEIHHFLLEANKNMAPKFLFHIPKLNGMADQSYFKMDSRTVIFNIPELEGKIFPQTFCCHFLISPAEILPNYRVCLL